MKKVKLRTPAKINLTLDVLGVKDGFHEISSLVTSIDVYDTITVKERLDFNVELKTKGISPECSAVDNNAYKAAKRFCKTFKTYGATVTVDKGIPVGGGLGGSSADIAGVLNAMKGLFCIPDSVVPIADSLGSDSSYMLKGGWAVLKGRGDKQQFLQLDFPLYLVIILDKQGVSAKQCYKRFDEQGKTYPPCTEQCLDALRKGDFSSFCKLAKNDLYHSTVTFAPAVEKNINALYEIGTPLAIMTGSGTAVLGVFDNPKERDNVYKKLKKVYGKKVIKAKTI